MKNGKRTLLERILSLALCFVLVAGMLPVQAFAEEGTEPGQAGASEGTDPGQEPKNPSLEMDEGTMTLVYPNWSGSRQATATDIEDAVVYSSSDSDVAEVSDAGVVTAKKAGTATITAKAGDHQKSYTVDVKKGTPSISVGGSYFVGDSVSVTGNDGQTAVVTHVSGTAWTEGNTIKFDQAGTVTITYSFQETDHYQAVTGSKEIAVSKRTPVLAASAGSCYVTESLTFSIGSTGDVPDFTIKSVRTAEGDTAAAEGNKVTFKTAGIYTVTASTDGNAEYSAASDMSVTVTVKAPEVALGKSAETKSYGDEDFKLAATTKPANWKVSYTSSKTDVAAVESDGTVSIKKPGTTTITATAEGGSSAVCVLTVAPAIVRVNLQGSYYVGESVDVSPVDVTAADRPAVIVNNTSDEAITVESNKIKFLAEGTVQISYTVTGNEYFAGGTYYQDVQVKMPTVTFAVAEQEMTFNGDALTASASVHAPAGTVLEYSSADPAIAAVDAAAGTVTAVKPGKTTITAKITTPDGLTDEASFGILVKKATLKAEDLYLEEPLIQMDTPKIMFNEDVPQAPEFTAETNSENAVISEDNVLSFQVHGSYSLTVTPKENEYYETTPITRAIKVHKNPIFASVTASGAEIEGVGNSIKKTYTIAPEGTLSADSLEIAVTITKPQEADKDCFQGDSETVIFDLSGLIAEVPQKPFVPKAKTYDWNGDGKTEQTVEFSLDLENITIMDGDVQVYPRQRPGFGFGEQTVERDFRDETAESGTYSQTVSGLVNGESAVYTVDQNAAVKGATVTFTNDGDITVTASVPFKFPYAAESASYVIKVSPVDQPGELVINLPEERTYGQEPAKLTVSGGITENATVTYAVTENDSVVTLEGDQLTYLKGGIVKLQATQSVPGYNDLVSDEISLTVEKAEQTIHHENATINLIYGARELVLADNLEFSNADADVQYALTFDSDVEPWAMISDGKLLLQSGGIGKVQISVSAREDEKYKAFTADTADYAVWVSYREKGDVEFYTDVEKSSDSWYNAQQVVLKARTTGGEALKLSPTPDFAGDWTLEKVFSEGKNEGSFHVMDSQGYISSAKEYQINIDSTAPQITASYNGEPIEEGKYYNKAAILEFKVVEANPDFTADMLSGKFTINGYAINLPWTQSGDTFTAPWNLTDDAYHVAASFKDPANNESNTLEHNFTVDTIKPVIGLALEPAAGVNEEKDDQGNLRTYYNIETLKATITITERNFDDKNVTVTLTNDKGLSEDYKAYGTAWDTNGDIHTFVMEFPKDANYTLKVECTDLAGNAGDAQQAFFTVDNEKPTGTVNVSTSENTGWSWNKLLEIFTFGIFGKEKLSFSANIVDSTAGVKTLQYFVYNLKDDISVDEALNSVEAGNLWIDYTNNTVKTEALGEGVIAAKRFVVFFKAVDKAGHISHFATNGLVLDNKESEGGYEVDIRDLAAPSIEVDENGIERYGIYTTDVTINVHVKDPDVGIMEGAYALPMGYSGLKKVSYSIASTDPGAEQYEDGVLFESKVDFDPNDEKTYLKWDELQQEFSGSFTVDAEKFNSNNVTVKIVAVDYSGNTQTKTVRLKIDRTKPAIKVSYDNNSVSNEKYFKANRVATIEILERNFDPAMVNAKIGAGHGNAPGLSDWTKTPGTGNLDDTKWTATIQYNRDNDYTFAISCTDKAGNRCEEGSVTYEGVAPQKFTVDKTAPIISMQYNNNDDSEPGYFKEGRVGTLKIVEHNFNSRDVKVTAKATLDNNSVQTVKGGGWKSNGDSNTCSYNFSQNADYTFEAAYTDLAGNPAQALKKHSFVVDTITPRIEITNLKNGSANRGSVAPVIRVLDHNFNEDKVQITMTVQNLTGVKNAAHSSTYIDIKDGTDRGRQFSYQELEAIRENDGLYRLTVTITDRAGNRHSEELVYVVNRFGSIYISENAATANLLNVGYTKDAPELKITEINPNKLEEYFVSLTMGGNVYNLTEDKEFTVEDGDTEYDWFEYTYTIKPEAFMDKDVLREGSYAIALNSTDEAANKNSLSAYAATVRGTENEIKFNLVIDCTKPNVVISGVENKMRYPEEQRTVRVGFQDTNLSKVRIALLIEGQENPVHEKELEGEELYLHNGEYTVDTIQNEKWQIVRVTAVDAAGNEFEHEDVRFLLTTNKWVLFINNTPLLVGTIVGASILLALAIYLIYKRKTTSDMA